MGKTMVDGVKPIPLAERKEVEMKSVGRNEPARGVGAHEPYKTPPMPRSLRVGPIAYTVTQDEMIGLRGAVEMGESGGTPLGHSDHLREQIWINGELSARGAAITMLHEALHAIMGLGTLASRFKEGGVTEEECIEGISTGLYSLLIDNPEMVAWIMETTR